MFNVQQKASDRTNPNQAKGEEDREAASVRALERLAILETVVEHELREKDETLLNGVRFMMADLCADIVAMTPPAKAHDANAASAIATDKAAKFEHSVGELFDVVGSLERKVS